MTMFGDVIRRRKLPPSETNTLPLDSAALSAAKAAPSSSTSPQSQFLVEEFFPYSCESRTYTLTGDLAVAFYHESLLYYEPAETYSEEFYIGLLAFGVRAEVLQADHRFPIFRLV